MIAAPDGSRGGGLVHETAHGMTWSVLLLLHCEAAAPLTWAPEASSSFSLPPLSLGGKGEKQRGIHVAATHEVTADDVAVAIITSSSTMGQRLPILKEAWVSGGDDARISQILFCVGGMGRAAASYPYLKCHLCTCHAWSFRR